MESDLSQPGSPATPGGPLQMATPERVNQRRDSVFSALRSQGRDSTVHDKISQFNNLSVSMQSKQLERKTADAALKRAMLGREEAEAELRRVKDESRILRQVIEEGKERERRVGERLETVMENYGRAKETHAHTQALWEKEIRRARKEGFKAQSSIVKLQEELKGTRATAKAIEENLQLEKERSLAREQEAFTARYQIVNVQEQLEQALQRIKLIEQERDAYKMAAKNEEVARLAAEGRIPLPLEDPDDEFASPPKKRKSSSGVRCRDPRVSLSTMEIMSSAASELEIEQLAEQVQWERQRADRAQEMIEFMQAECQMNCCPCSKSKRRTSMLLTGQIPTEQPEEPIETIEAATEGHGEKTIFAATQRRQSPIQQQELQPAKGRNGPRRSTIFCPEEGIFRTVPEHEALALEAQQKAEIVAEASEEAEFELPTSMEEEETHSRTFARTPSVDPPAFAILAEERTSLLSLIDAPSGDAQADPLPNIRSIPIVRDDEPVQQSLRHQVAEDEAEEPHEQQQTLPRQRASGGSQSSKSKTIYTVTETTTVPVRDNRSSSSSFSQKLRTPSSCSNASFDLSDPAMTPTMTREEALAKIRERRGRARSGGQGPPSRPTSGMSKRDVSGTSSKGGSRPTRS